MMLLLVFRSSDSVSRPSFTRAAAGHGTRVISTLVQKELASCEFRIEREHALRIPEQRGTVAGGGEGETGGRKSCTDTQSDGTGG